MKRQTEEDKQKELERFMAQRRSGIGASDSAALFGVSDWRTPLDVYADKIGAARTMNQEENEAMEWGLILEPFIAKKYMRASGRKIIAGRRFRVHPTHVYLICHLDRLIEDEHMGLGCLELKNISSWKAKEWEEEPPLQYQIQIQHQMLVAGLEWGSIAALIGGQKFVWYDQKRNPGFTQKLLDVCQDFWMKHVLVRKPPPAISGHDMEALKAIYSGADGQQIDLPPEAKLWDQRITVIERDMDTLKSEKELIKAKILELIGNNSIGIIPDCEYCYSYRTSPRAGYVVEATQVKTLRRIKNREYIQRNPAPPASASGD